METTGSIINYKVTNGTDKDGTPTPRIIVTVECEFKEEIVCELAKHTARGPVNFRIKQTQPDMF